MPFGFETPTVHGVAAIAARTSGLELVEGTSACLDVVFLDRAGKELAVETYFTAGRGDIAQAYAEAINSVALRHGGVTREQLADITGDLTVEEAFPTRPKLQLVASEGRG